MKYHEAEEELAERKKQLAKKAELIAPIEAVVSDKDVIVEEKDGFIEVAGLETLVEEKFAGKEASWREEGAGA
jgi:hypothetical protein